MLLYVHVIVWNELVCYAVNPDGSDGCHVIFASRESAVDPNGNRFDGGLVHLVAVYTPDHETGLCTGFTITIVGMLLLK